MAIMTKVCKPLVSLTPRMKAALSLLAEKNDRALILLQSGLWFRESDAEPGSHRWARFKDDPRPEYGGFLWNTPGQRLGSLQIIWAPEESTMVLTPTVNALVGRRQIRFKGPAVRQFKGNY